jgi:nucleoside-diphosphate-sugar epimerase
MNNGTHKILITGGFGFIGSHLTERMLAEPGVHVHVVDNLSTSPIDLETYLAHVPRAGRLTYDICTIQEYFANPAVPRFDEVYHLASVVGPVGVLKHGGRILRSIVGDTYAVAGYALNTGARLCDVSTSEVYGGGRDGYCSEKDSMIIPPKISIRLEYAVSKLGAEVAMINMARTVGLHGTIVRPFNVAGPRQSPSGGFVLPRFLDQALAGEPLTVYGDGTMIRAFTHVRDIVDGIVRVMRNGRPGEAYNIGNPANKTTILDLAKLVIKVTGSSSPLCFVDPKKLWGPLFEEANDKYPDADRAMNELGWLPEFGLYQIVAETLCYIRERRLDRSAKPVGR